MRFKKTCFSITLSLESRHGNGAGWGRVLPSPSPFPTPIYLLITLPIPNGMRNWISSPSPMGLGILASSSSPQWINFFLLKRVFLSFNGNIVIHYPIICAHFSISLSNNSVVAPLTINESFYIMIVIKPNNMTYHIINPLNKNKNMTFLHLGRVWYGFEMRTYISVTRLVTVLWNREKLKLIPKPSQIGVGLGRYPWARVLLPCLLESINYGHFKTKFKTFFFVTWCS